MIKYLWFVPVHGSFMIGAWISIQDYSQWVGATTDMLDPWTSSAKGKLGHNYKSFMPNIM
jgi:hypothetical protein